MRTNIIFKTVCKNWKVRTTTDLFIHVYSLLCELEPPFIVLIYSFTILPSELVINMNDIIDNRIEKNLRTISKMQLVDLPSETIELEVFVKMQENHVENQSGVLQGKNVEIETAVQDIIRLATSYPLDPHIEPVDEATKLAVQAYYNRTMYRAMLTTTKSSLISMKKRIKGGGGGLFSLASQKPFFELHIELSVPNVSVDPSLEDVQKAISKASKAVLTIAKGVYDWGQDHLPMKERVTFFESITKDIEIVRTVLLLTGSMQGLKQDVKRYLDQFYKYEWLWKDDMQQAYKSFLSRKPTIDDYENCLKRFENVDAEVKQQASVQVIGALRLTTKGTFESMSNCHSNLLLCLCCTVLRCVEQY